MMNMQNQVQHAKAVPVALKSTEDKTAKGGGGSGFGVVGLGFRVYWGLRFSIWGLGFSFWALSAATLVSLTAD